MNVTSPSEDNWYKVTVIAPEDGSTGYTLMEVCEGGKINSIRLTVYGCIDLSRQLNQAILGLTWQDATWLYASGSILDTKHLMKKEGFSSFGRVACGKLPKGTISAQWNIDPFLGHPDTSKLCPNCFKIWENESRREKQTPPTSETDENTQPKKKGIFAL